VQVRASADLRTDLRPGDIGAMSALHGCEYAAEYDLDFTFEAYVGGSIARFALVLADDPEAGRIWLAEDEEGLVGCIAVTRSSDSEGWLRWFVVARQTRGQGVGRKLLSEAIEYARERFDVLKLETFSELAAAAHLYRSSGFVVTDSEPRSQWGRQIELQHYALELR
jgi:GNAT superfamily N-acetyltransferase